MTGRVSQRAIMLSAGAGVYLASGCSYAPRNGEVLARSDSAIVWAGGTTTGNQSVTLVRADSGPTFSLGAFIAGATTAAGSMTDAVGTKWFGWKRDDVVIPHSVWKKAGTNRMEAKVKTVVMDSAGVMSPLDSFDVGAETDDCVNTRAAEGLANVVNNCKSRQGGIVTLTAPCGTFNDACCESTCDTGLQCHNSKCLKAPGAACTAHSECGPLDRCFAGTCAQPASFKFGNASRTLPTYKTYTYARSSTSGFGTAAQFTPRQAARQSLTAFDWPYGLTIDDNGGANVVGDLIGGRWACLPTRYTTLDVAPGSSLSTTITPGVGTSSARPVHHVVRYNHGTCSKRVLWKETFFEPFTERFRTEAEAELARRLPGVLKPFTTFSRNYDIAQVQFRSDGTAHEWGFFYEGSYDTTVELRDPTNGATFRQRTHLMVSPGYSFQPSSSDGFVKITSLTQGVTMIPDVSRATPAIEATLKTLVPKIMSDLIRETMETPLTTITHQLKLPTPSDVSCSSGATIASQQDTCLPKVQAALGFFGPFITAKHVSCNRSNQCAVHPPVQAVNVLPNALELVFAPEIEGGQDNLTALYQAIPGLCDPPQSQGVTSGYIATLHHGNGAFATNCGPILPF